MTARLAVAFAAAAALLSLGAPGASACVPGDLECTRACVNRPPWIDTRDPVGTVVGAVPFCAVS